MHEVFACPKPCEQLHSACYHLCEQLTCGEDCMIELGNILLSCGHTNDKVPCYLTQDLGQVKCSTLVQKQVPGCNHIVGTECSTDVTLESFRCPAPCSMILHCGHVCPVSCFKYNVKARNGNSTIKHIAYRKVCGRAFNTSNHTCPACGREPWLACRCKHGR